MKEGPHEFFSQKDIRQMRQDFRRANIESRNKVFSTEPLPFVSEVLKKEGEERRQAAKQELERLCAIIRPMLKDQMDFNDFLAGKKPFGEAEYQYSKARKALKATLEIFFKQEILSEGEVEEILFPLDEDTEEISVSEEIREAA